MAYNCYLFGVPMPETPGKLTLKIKGKNSTLTLLNEGDINILKSPGLTEISLSLTFPMLTGSLPPEYYLGLLEKAKTKKQVTQFIMTRTSPAGKLLFDTNIKVSVEDYNITENAEDGLDVKVEVKLKQYRDYGTKTVTVKAASSSSSGASANNQVTTGGNIVAGDTVKIIDGAVYGGVYDKISGMKVPSPYIGKWYTVTKVQTNAGTEEALIKELYSWVALKYLQKQGVSTTTQQTVSVTTERAATTAPKATTHTVKSDDTLWGIAKKYYGDGAQYNLIYEANKSEIKNPSLIHVGQALTIP